MPAVLKSLGVPTRVRIRLVASTTGMPLDARPGRRSRRSRARFAVLLAIAAYFGIQALTNLAIREEWNSIRDPLYFDKLALFQNEKPAFFEAPTTRAPLTVLFTGSSRTQNAVDTGALEASLSQHLGRPVSSFNFALAGCGPVTNAVYLRRLAQDGVKPDFVLLEVHPVFLAGPANRPDPPEARWLLTIRLRPDELPLVASLGFPAEPSRASGWRGWIASWYQYRFLLVDRYASGLRTIPKLNEGHEPDRHGFVRARQVADRERHILGELTRLQYQDYFPDFQPTGPGVAALRDMLTTCREQGWKGAIFVPPESTAFRGWYAEPGRLELDVVLQKLAVEFDVPLIDARTWVPDDHIGDGHHLCGSGADLLTAKLARHALAPWMVRATSPARP